MLKYMYKKNPVLTRILIVSVVLILIWGVILIVDSIQKTNLRMTEHTLPFPSFNNSEPVIYDVDGLSDEEIDNLVGGEQ